MDAILRAAAGWNQESAEVSETMSRLRRLDLRRVQQIDGMMLRNMRHVAETAIRARWPETPDAALLAAIMQAVLLRVAESVYDEGRDRATVKEHEKRVLKELAILKKYMATP